ncbi:MAG: hypothetical protein AAGA25_17320 [Planctomycetota bacterium]
MKQLRWIAAISLGTAVLFFAVWLLTRPTNEERTYSAFDQALHIILTDSRFKSTREFYGPTQPQIIYYPEDSFLSGYVPSVDGLIFHSTDLTHPPNPHSPRRLTVGSSGSGVTQPGWDQLSTYWSSTGEADNEFLITIWNSGGSGPDGIHRSGRCYATFRFSDGLWSRKVKLWMTRS